MSEEIVYLDLDEVELWGWEDSKSDLVIDAIVRGIEAGDDFPAVPVVRLKDGYCLWPFARLKGGRSSFTDGGHHRAAGHYIAGEPLKCRVVRTHDDLTISNYYWADVPIESIEIFDDDGEIYGWCRKVHDVYR